jgi:hypothetical protein
VPRAHHCQGTTTDTYEKSIPRFTYLSLYRCPLIPAQTTVRYDEILIGLNESLEARLANVEQNYAALLSQMVSRLALS